jgi:Uma2 family endonuclease
MLRCTVFERITWQGGIMSTVRIPPDQRFRVSGIDWKGYLAYSDGLGQQHVRVTYDQGELELMTLSFAHERDKSFLGRLVEALTEELAIDLASGGSMTCRQEDMERAFEPDECFWIAHEEAVRVNKVIDFDRDPPPDLAIEVEISRSTMDRLRLYASLGVPELWRWDGKRLRVVLLGPDGTYHDSDVSRAFPFLPVSELARFLTMRGVSQTQVMREFRAWVREQQAAGWPAMKRKRNRSQGGSKGRRKPK